MLARARALNRLNVAGYRRIGLRSLADWMERNERLLALWTRLGGVLMVLVGLVVFVVVARQ